MSTIVTQGEGRSSSDLLGILGEAEGRGGGPPGGLRAHSRRWGGAAWGMLTCLGRAGVVERRGQQAALRARPGAERIRCALRFLFLLFARV